MSTLENLFVPPSDFTGDVRVFPLPNLVMFPHVLQPLHIFEPRYRDLMDDALRGDRLLAMAVLAPGWEADYEGRPALRRVGCLGRIATYHRLEDGRFNLLLAGLKRVRFGAELDRETRYRQFRAEAIEDIEPLAPAPEWEERLLGLMQRLAGPAADALAPIMPKTDGKIPLALLTDVLAYASDLPLERKIELLEEARVLQRAEQLAGELESRLEPDARPSRPSAFPPSFSLN